MKKVLLFILFFFANILLVKADGELAQNSKSAILIENSTGKVLFEKNADEALPPASMTKVMTMLLVMENLDKNVISLDDDVHISEKAAKMGGSQVFLEANSNMKLAELLKAIAIASANDAAIALAEHIGGSEENFVKMMNDRAQELNLESTNFVSPHGLDAEGHLSSARDMAIMARELLKYDEILNYTSIYEEYLTKPDGNKTWMVNTNKLVRFYKGIDGLKTGFTDNAKYCLTATGYKNNLRLISVVMGADTSEKRSQDTIGLMNYGFSNYKINVLFKIGTVIKDVKVKNGKQEKVDLVLAEDATELLNNSEKKTNYTYNTNIEYVSAPIKSGEIVGNLEIYDEEGNHVGSYGLTVKDNLQKAKYFDYLYKNLKTFFGGTI